MVQSIFTAESGCDALCTEIRSDLSLSFPGGLKSSSSFRYVQSQSLFSNLSRWAAPTWSISSSHSAGSANAFIVDLTATDGPNPAAPAPPLALSTTRTSTTWRAVCRHRIRPQHGHDSRPSPSRARTPSVEACESNPSILSTARLTFLTEGGPPRMSEEGAGHPQGTGSRSSEPLDCEQVDDDACTSAREDLERPSGHERGCYWREVEGARERNR